MRLMMKGDMAFFYHSNCKVPGIVGTMEIVREHSVDGRSATVSWDYWSKRTNLPLETAFDPEHPYFDEKSNRENPKWCVVHVEYRQKFPAIIKLKDLQKFAKDGGLLENMQTLKTSRLSVSKVSKKEWDFIMSLVDMEDVSTLRSQFSLINTPIEVVRQLGEQTTGCHPLNMPCHHRRKERLTPKTTQVAAASAQFQPRMVS